MRESGRGLRANSGPTRREALVAGGLGALGAALGGAGPVHPSGGDRAVIWLMLVGGPSPLESFDPRPEAPAEVRGPFGSIATAVPGLRFVEHLPKLAARAGRLTLLRALHHDAAPVHETGLQLLQTGRLSRDGEAHPFAGSVAARLLGSSPGLPPAVILPGPIGHTGVDISRGQTAGPLGPEFEPWSPGLGPDPGGREFPALDRALDLSREPGATRAAYGPTPFGRDCLRARRLVEAGARFVTVNSSTTVFDRVSWDGHGARPFATFDDYRRTLLPALDAALSALLDDLARTGRLGSTLVVATGEFGRTPRVNARGGRDHWPGVWTATLAGGGVRGGQAVGASDRQAGAPADRPVTPAELLATVYRSLGLDGGRLCDAPPVAEAFG